MILLQWKKIVRGDVASVGSGAGFLFVFFCVCVGCFFWCVICFDTYFGFDVIPFIISLG